MLFNGAITALLALTFVSAAPIERRQSASKVVNDLELVSSDVAELQAIIDGFSGTLTQEIEFEGDMDNLNSATKATTTDTLANPPFITTDSTRLTGKFNIFAPKLAELIKVTGTMAPVFNSTGFTSTVLPAVQTLQANTDALFLALETLVDGTDVAAATSNQASVDSAFKKTIESLEANTA